MTNHDNIAALALALWAEQLDAGLGHEGETVDHESLDDWLANRQSLADLRDAADGDAAALARVRTECGLPVLG